MLQMNDSNFEPKKVDKVHQPNRDELNCPKCGASFNFEEVCANNAPTEFRCPNCRYNFDWLGLLPMISK